MQNSSVVTFTMRCGTKLVGDVAGPEDGETVALLHGVGQTRHAWGGLRRRLAGLGYRVVSYDARGHGDSDWSQAGDYALSTLADDLRTVLAGFRAPAALVGASMGGITSFIAIAENTPEFASALVLADITLHPAVGGIGRIRDFMQGNAHGFATIEEAADVVAAFNPCRPRPSDPAGLMKNLRRRADGRLYWHWDPRLIEGDRRLASYAGRLPELASRMTLPALLVRGGRSEVVSDEGIERMQALLPQMEVCEIPEAGHMVAGHRNDEFNDAVEAFLARHSARNQGWVQ